MAKITPSLYASGKWVLSSPWAAAPDITYVCHAIRTFEDIEKLGEDVYQRYYKPYIIDGNTYNGKVWYFANEKLEKPNIITLISTDNRVIYVPDTFIVTFPDTAEFQYSQLVLAVPLGLLPDTYDVTHITAAVKDKINTLLGIDINPLLARGAVNGNPTLDEHLALEANRQAAIRRNVSYETLLIQEKQRTTVLEERVRLYETILRENGLLT